MGVVAVALVAPLRRVLAGADVQPLLIAVQSYRVIAGGVFLVLLGLDDLPALFAVPAGAGDVLVGLAAPFVARWLLAGRVGPALTWNLLGLLDLVLAVSLGVATAPGPTHLLLVTPSTLALSIPPLVVVPTYLVPLSVLLHLASLRYLLAARPPTSLASQPAESGPAVLGHGDAARAGRRSMP